ncbi:MAG: hypothetical protein IJE68_02055 [Clostridia bacterium]|nr:hypothetical protein [Clostridia bacterium]
MAKKQINREERKWKRIINLIFIALSVGLLGYAFLLSSIFESFVGKMTSHYEVTDTSIEVNLEDYKYAIVKGYIVDDSASNRIRLFYYPTESNTIFYEDILEAKGASMDADIRFARTITISNWKHPWLHELIFVSGVLFILVIPIPFCKAISRIKYNKLKNGEN